jgi:hypothetical protein
VLWGRVIHVEIHRSQRYGDSIVSVTSRRLIATAVLALSATSASTASYTLGALPSGPSTLAATAVTTPSAAGVPKGVQSNATLPAEAVKVGYGSNVGGVVSPVTNSNQGGRFAFGESTFPEPSGFALVLAGFAVVAFVMRRRQPD